MRRHSREEAHCKGKATVGIYCFTNLQDSAYWLQEILRLASKFWDVFTNSDKNDIDNGEKHGLRNRPFKLLT